MKNDLTQKFSKGTIIIHWLTTLLILLLFPLGKYISDINPSDKIGLIKAILINRCGIKNIHAILGIIVFILTMFRSWQFFKAQRPSHLKTGSKFNDKLAVYVHNAFYFLLFGISLSGIAVMIIGGYGNAITSGNLDLIQDRENIIPLKAHNILAVIMMILLVIHVVGVIKHYILLKENTLKRII